MQGSFAPVRVLFSPFDGSKILPPSAKKTFGFYKLIGPDTFFLPHPKDSNFELKSQTNMTLSERLLMV